MFYILVSEQRGSNSGVEQQLHLLAIFGSLEPPPIAPVSTAITWCAPTVTVQQPAQPIVKPRYKKKMNKAELEEMEELAKAYAVRTHMPLVGSMRCSTARGEGNPCSTTYPRLVLISEAVSPPRVRTSMRDRQGGEVEGCLSRAKGYMLGQGRDASCECCPGELVPESRPRQK